MDEASSKHVFLRNLSHDFTNPLSSMAGFLGLLLDPDAREPLSPRQRRMLAAVNRATTHLLGTMKDMANLSRLEEGQWRAKPSRVDFGAIIQKTIEDMTPRLFEQGIVLDVRKPPRGPFLWVDKTMTELFAEALLRLAERQTPAQGRITLRLTNQKKAMAGILEHSGEERSTALLKATTAATVTGPRPVEGYMSLGLPLVHRLAAAQGGTLSAAPRPQGGTRLRFRLPLPPA